MKTKDVMEDALVKARWAVDRTDLDRAKEHIENARILLKSLRPAPSVILRPFTEADWQGLAGATPFKDGSQPLICHLEALAEWGKTVIQVVADPAGIEVEMFTESGDTI